MPNKENLNIFTEHIAGDLLQHITGETTMTGVPDDELFSFANGEDIVISPEFNEVNGYFSPDKITVGKLKAIDPYTGEFILNDVSNNEFRVPESKSILLKTFENIGSASRGVALLSQVAETKELIQSAKRNVIIFSIAFLVLALFGQHLLAILLMVIALSNDNDAKYMQATLTKLHDKIKLYLCYRAALIKINGCSDEEDNSEAVNAIAQTAMQSEDFVQYISTLIID